MVEKEAIKELVSSYLEKGFSREQIKRMLVAKGWPKEIANQYSSTELKGVLPLISVKSMSKSFGKHEILKKVNFDIRDGEIVGIIGVSGAGKTTLLNILVGFVEPDEGDVIINLPERSFSAVGAHDEVKRVFGFSTQSPSFYPHLTSSENIVHFASLYGIETAKANAICDSLLKLIGLSDAKDVLAQKLSGGMQKRLDIACALVHSPKILILDEPVSDLDPLMRQQMWDLIKAINRRGTTVLIASHFLAELESFCDRIALMRNKRIAEFGTMQELQHGKKDVVEIEFASHNYPGLLQEIQRARIECEPSVSEGRLVISTYQKEALLHVISGFIDRTGEAILNMRVSKPTIKEIFEELASQ